MTSSTTKKEHFTDVSFNQIKYVGPESTDPLTFRYYNPDEILLGKSMKEWLKFSICFWHTFVGGGGSDPFGEKTLNRPWEDDIPIVDGEKPEITLAKRRIDVAFEFYLKLGIQYYTFHDIDVSPEGTTIQETHDNLDIIVDYLLKKQNETGIKLLWSTQNLFTNKRYMNGGMTNPSVHIFCYAASTIKKVMDINNKLGGANHVFWGGREGYNTTLNTDIKREIDHMAALYKMAIKYKAAMGYDAQFLIEPKPREPTKHQYDYDAQTTMSFLHTYGIQNEFKLNIEPNHTTLAGHEPHHDILFASKYNMLGSIDSNTGDTLLGWDTDNFPMDVVQTTNIMSVVVDQGGLGTGGLNFDCKVRRESIDPIDLFIGHIGAMDCYAKGLRNAIKMAEDKIMHNMLNKRYISWNKEDIGKKIEAGKATLDECDEYAKITKEGKEPINESGKQELYELIRNRYVF